MGVMVALVLAVVTYSRAFFVPRHCPGLEAAARRQQFTVFKPKQPRPRLRHLDRLFWIALRRLWPDWANALLIAKGEHRGVLHRVLPYDASSGRDMHRTTLFGDEAIN